MTAMSEETYGRYGAVKQFPAGLRVLSVDDDPVSLKVLEGLLRRCNYQPTMTRDPVMALQMLREGKDQFDLVISDVHMPDMDGFELLEHIGLEMDLPVIMLSANEEIETVMKGITNGACDYLVKPLCAKELKNIWQHIVRRRNPHLRNDRSSINSGKNYYADEKQGPAKDIRKCPGMIKYHGDVSHEIKENVVLSAQTKPRVRWTKELHGIFLKAVNQLGIDKAVPKKILDMMDVDYLNRENIASHLQKYRLYLKKVKTKVENNTIMNSNPSADASTRLSSSFNAMKEPESFQYYHGHGQYQPSRNNFSTRIDSHSPSSFGADNVMPTQSKQRDDLGMGQIDNGGSMFLKDVTSASSPLPDARQHTSSSNSYANMPADAFSSFRSCGISYSNILCGKPLEASIGNDTGNYFARIPYGGLLVHANQLPVQPSPQLRHGHSSQKNPCGDDNRDIGNFWQDAKLSDHGNTDGRESQANILNINHVTSLATASAGSMCQNKLQNQMGAILSTSEQNVSFNVASNDTSSIQLLNESSTLGITSGIGSYTLPNLQMVSYVTSTHMLNGGGEGGILSMQEQGSVDPEAVNDQPNYNNGPLIGTNELDGSCSWDDILVLNEKI